ncbi:hypothetical protein D3C73_1424750 [compost metagenome]
MDAVVSALKKTGIQEVEILNSIGVVLIVPDKNKIADIKKIDGVLGVEEERDISI